MGLRQACSRSTMHQVTKNEHQMLCQLGKCQKDLTRTGHTTKMGHTCGMAHSTINHRIFIIVTITQLCLVGSKAWKKSFKSRIFGPQLNSMHSVRDSSASLTAQTVVAVDYCFPNQISLRKDLTSKNTSLPVAISVISIQNFTAN